MSEDASKHSKHLSLLSRQSTGGDIAQEGFSYQDGVMLVRIPSWLARDGFTACLREGLDDIEAKFFVPKYGFVKERIQVKRERITNSTFGALLRAFMEIYNESPTSYQWFTFVFREIADDVKPLEFGLRRIRGPYSFYGDDGTVQENSYRDYLIRAEELGYTEEETRFLFEHVLIDTSVLDAAEELFMTELTRAFPEYSHLSMNLHQDIRNHMKLLIQSHTNNEIDRRDIEQTIRNVIPSDQRPSPRPITLYTAGVIDEIPANALHFEWETFFGGEAKNFPPPDAWDEVLVSQLQATKEWILNHRRTEALPGLYLTGSRRLSAAFAIGFTFRAVTGFSLEMNHRGQLWATNHYANSDTAQYGISAQYIDAPGDDLVVSISIPPQDIVANVEQFIAASTKNVAKLHIRGESTIQSSEQANASVNNIKQAILQTLADRPRQTIHLFYAGPSYLALFLGHRLNAIAKVQCYEYLSGNEYVPTCTLMAR